MSNPENELRELRRALWALADKWDKTDLGASESIAGAVIGEATLKECATDLRKVLTYPLATVADELELQRTYGKTAEELADEAERCTCMPARYDGDDGYDRDCPMHGVQAQGE